MQSEGFDNFSLGKSMHLVGWNNSVLKSWLVKL